VSNNPKNPNKPEKEESLEATEQNSCPLWISRLIKELLAHEVRLGNIQPVENNENGEEEGWQSADLEDLQRRLEARSQGGGRSFDEAAAEALFTKIACSLRDDGFDPKTIAMFINAGMQNKSRLPYCDATDVEEALSAALH
jgi:hypothetical protein